MVKIQEPEEALELTGGDQIRHANRQSAPAEAHQRLPRSTQNTSIADLPNQRSGFIEVLRNRLPGSHPLTAPGHPLEQPWGQTPRGDR